MEFEWDQDKAEGNLAKHRVAFEAIAAFAFETALVWQDDRKNYGEVRMIALGFIEGRLHHLTYTMRGNVLRVISLRKANDRENDRYVENR